MPKQRKIEVEIDGTFQTVNFLQLKPGDKFKMFEPDGKEVRDVYGNTEFIATSEPYQNKRNEWQIDYDTKVRW